MCRALFDTAKTSLYLYTYRICFDVAMRNTLLYWFILKPTHVFSSMTMIQYSFPVKYILLISILKIRHFMAKNQLFNIINIILLQLYIYMVVQFALSVYDINFIHFNWSCTNVYINFTRYEKLKYNIEIWQHFNCLASNFKT